VIGVGGEVVEDVVEGEVRLPAGQAGGGGEVLAEPVLQVGDPLAFPDLVGRADEEVFDRAVRLGPGAVGAGEAGQPRGNLAGEQQSPARGLVG
jgi:hypothetical protein